MNQRLITADSEPEKPLKQSEKFWMIKKWIFGKSIVVKQNISEHRETCIYCD